MSRLLILCCSLLLCLLSGAKAQEKLQIGVSVDVMPITSDFSGREIVLFGAIENAEQAALYRGEYHVLIEVTGSLEEAVVRKKERIAGIWINAASQTYREVPSYYSLLSRVPLANVADLSRLHQLGIGIAYLKARPADVGDIRKFLIAGEFSTALRRKRIEEGLFSEDPKAIQHISPSLFRATLRLPPNVPIGLHTVRAHLFYKGKRLDHVTQVFEVRKVGFERWIYDLAHQYSLLYGLLCVFLAIFTGWFANFVFRKN